MRAALPLFFVVFIMLCLFTGCSDRNQAEYGDFFATIVNQSTADVTDIELSMVGSSDIVKIKKLAAGENSNRALFVLPYFEGERPESWGDYSGSYTQNGTVKEISILNYEHKYNAEVTIKIMDQSYMTIFQH